MSDDPRVSVPAELVERLRDATPSAWCDVDLLPSSLWLAARRLVAAVERPDEGTHSWWAKGRDPWVCTNCGATEPRENEFPELAGCAPPPVPVSDEAEAERQRLAKALRAKARLRFDEYGPQDERGSTIWDVANWLMEAVHG